MGDTDVTLSREDAEVIASAATAFAAILGPMAAGGGSMRVSVDGTDQFVDLVEQRDELNGAVIRLRQALGWRK